MGIAEDAGRGPGRREEPGGDEAEAEAAETPARDVRRLGISKEAVRRWVAANGISLERTCDPGSFIDGYALKPVIGEEDT